MKDAWVAQLRSEGVRVTTEPSSMDRFTRDQCLSVGSGWPTAVVHAASTRDVVTVLRGAQERRSVVVARGAGTGLAGGANAVDDCIILDLSGMQEIVEINHDARTATVQPGVINADLDLAARKMGMFYPPDPGSRAISTIGGNIATNAGGMCCAKYGVTADHVMQLKAVLPGGQLLTTGGLSRKDVAGLDLTKLLVGSEGTLAVIVEATVRLLPITGGVSTAAIMFDSIASAVEAVVEITRVAVPSVLEIMDRTTIDAVNQMTAMGLDESAEALLLVQCDGLSAVDEMRRCVAAARSGPVMEVYETDDPDEGRLLMEARRVALPALERLGTTLLDDVCVPVQQLVQLQGEIEKISARSGLVIGTFGHAADGNLHPTIVYDASRDELERAVLAFEEIVAATTRLGGSITGEHGVGQLKMKYLGAQVGVEELALMRRIKAAFDPFGILNPGRGF